MQFVIDGGYQKNELWCYNSLKWIQNNNISMPLYWIKKNGKYFKFINGVTYDLTTNLPSLTTLYLLIFTPFFVNDSILNYFVIFVNRYY